MSRRWIIILLFISLAFNLAVMSMFIYATIFHRPPFCPPGARPPMEMARPNHMRHNKDRGKLPFALEDKEEIRELRTEFMQKRKDFMQIIKSENYDEKQALAAMEASLKAQEVLERKLGTSLIELRNKMSAKEADEFFEEWMHKFKRRPDFDDKRRDFFKDDNQKRR